MISPEALALIAIFALLFVLGVVTSSAGCEPSAPKGEKKPRRKK